MLSKFKLNNSILDAILKKMLRRENDSDAMSRCLGKKTVWIMFWIEIISRCKYCDCHLFLVIASNMQQQQPDLIKVGEGSAREESRRHYETPPTCHRIRLDSHDAQVTQQNKSASKAQFSNFFLYKFKVNFKSFPWKYSNENADFTCNHHFGGIIFFRNFLGSSVICWVTRPPDRFVVVWPRRLEMGVVETIKANKIPFTQLFFSLEKKWGKMFLLSPPISLFRWSQAAEKEKIKYNNYKTLLAVVTLRRREAKILIFQTRGRRKKKKIIIIVLSHGKLVWLRDNDHQPLN